MNKNKSQYFSAFADWLNDWYGKAQSNDLSKLKVLKLLFLWVAWNEEYLKIFNNFVAWDLWPVEKDIYDLIGWNEIEGFCINSSSLKKTDAEIKYSEDAILFATTTINFLKSKNSSLIKLSASSLVDITHKWNCWHLTRNFNLKNIPTELILSERWYYS